MSILIANEQVPMLILYLFMAVLFYWLWEHDKEQGEGRLPLLGKKKEPELFMDL